MRRKETKSSEDVEVVPIRRLKIDETHYRCLDCDFIATLDNFNHADNEIICLCCGSSKVVKVSTIEHLYDK